MENLKQEMQKTIAAMEKDFQAVRTGRANPHILDRVYVDYYGNSTAINQVSNISVPEAQLLVIIPWEKKMLAEIEKAILKSDIGINPQNDGNVIRLHIPSLSEERRAAMVKQVHKIAEDSRTSVRNKRRQYNNTIKQDFQNKEITEDEKKKQESEAQKITDEFVVEIDKISKKKVEELSLD